jgi:hypothetical protein
MGERVIDRALGSGGSSSLDGAIALDGLAYGIDQLDAIVVFRIGDGRLHAAWIRPGSGFVAEETAESLRDAYRVCLGVSQRLAASASYGDREGAPGLFATLEMPSRNAMIMRSRAFGIGCVFEASMPLGMARLVTTRLARAIEPELPLVIDVDGMRPPPLLTSPPSTEPAPLSEPEPPIEPHIPYTEMERDLPPRTLEFPSTGAAIVRRSSSKPPPIRTVGRATGAEIDRIKRILDYLQVHAPEPHVAHLRVALRAGVTPVALERPDGLAANKMALVETAVEEILGIDLSDLGSIT